MCSMKFSNKLLSVEAVKNTDIVDYLLTLGFKPSKISRNDYWFISPFRDEKTPSFKVNRNLNRWYDFGEGKGGNLVDFGVQFHHCTVADFLRKMKSSFSFQQQNNFVKEEDDDSKKIKITGDKEISSLVLVRYLHKRRIPLNLAVKFCRQIDYELYGKNYYAIGFKNNSGGYELRNEKFKASSSPKDVTVIKNNSDKLTVFEGFFNFLSYQAIHEKTELQKTNFLVLNSASFFQKNLPLMQAYKSVHLFLDRDTTGQKCIQKALDTDKQKFIDESSLYKGYKDLNDWIVHIGKAQKQSAQLKP